MLTIAHMAQIMVKRIPVSEDRWKELGRIKEAGQTYDELLGKLLQTYNRRDLAFRMDAAEKGKGNWTKLEDL